MPLYSASQLIGKNMLLNKTVNVYSVLDLNEEGDNAQPIGTLKSGETFVVDSYLAPTTGYTSIYNITYAPRQYPYFTYYDGTKYNAIMIVGDGRFSLSALKDQGALTVAEEVAAAAAEQKEATDPIGSFFSKLGLGGLTNFIKPLLIIIVILVLMPLIINAFGSIKAIKK